MKRITRVHVNIGHRQLNWAISMHIIYCLLWFEGRGCYDGRHEMEIIFHLEEAAIGGHAIARHYLALREKWYDRFDKAVKHFIIAANLGYDGSLKELKGCYAEGKAIQQRRFCLGSSCTPGCRGCNKKSTEGSRRKSRGSRRSSVRGILGK